VKSAANGGAHDGVDAVGAFTKTSRKAGCVPSKTEGDILIRGAPKTQAEGGGRSIVMSDDAINVDPAAVFEIRVGELAGLTHDIANMAVEEHRVGFARGVARLAKRFGSGNLEKESSSNHVDSSDHRIERCIRQPGVFVDSKILSTFVESKADMKRPNVVEG
jgi:hypothetical protein